MRTTILFAASLAAARSLHISPRDYPTALTPDQVEADITLENLQRNLQSLMSIATANNHTRAFGLPGYRASVDYILSRTQVPEMNTSLQSFTSIWEHTRSIQLFGPDGKPVYVLSPQFNNPTPQPGGINAPLVDLPGNSTGCTEAEWAAVDVKGKIPIVRRGPCNFATKAGFATQHGAVAVIFYNTVPGNKFISPSIFNGVGNVVPAGTTSLEVGTQWKNRLASGEKFNVTLIVDSESGMKECWNVISETKDGDAESVVMLGAHLDSVQRGPGINDDGSGSAALLEIMDSIRKHKGVKNKVRFAWWGAEEAGLVGSEYYTNHLSEKEVNAIRYYFNYDMIGSINPAWSVVQNNNSGSVPKIMGDYLASKGKEVEYEESDSGSDYYGFANLGIPVSGLFTGAGDPYDPCYHMECDTLDNINWEAMTIMSKAAGRGAASVALSLDGVPPRTKKSKGNFKAEMTERDYF